jgi:hypothetical protein
METLTREIDDLLSPAPKPPPPPKMTAPKPSRQTPDQIELGIPRTPPKGAGSSLDIGKVLSAPVKAAEGVARDLLKESPKEGFQRQVARYRTRKPGKPRPVKRSALTEIASEIEDRTGLRESKLRRDKQGHLRVKRFAGVKPLGRPYVQEFNRAAQQGKIGLSKRHLVTTPAIRGATRELRGATKQARRLARPNLAGLQPAERFPAVLAVKAAKQTGIPASLLMSLMRQESGFQPEAVSSASAFGLTQFIPSTAASYGVKPGSSRAAQWSQVKGAAEKLRNDGFLTDPQGALYAYTGGYSAKAYNNPVLQGAADYKALDKGTSGVPRPVARRLKTARSRGRQLGLKIPRMGAAGAPPGGGSYINVAPVKYLAEFKVRYKGKMVTLSDIPNSGAGDDAIAASIAPLANVFFKRYGMNIHQGYGGSGTRSVSLGHTTTGTSTDVAPEGDQWSGAPLARFEKGLAVLTSLGFEVGYNGTNGTQAWPGHGTPSDTDQPHAHINWVGYPENTTAPDARRQLRDLLIHGGKVPVPDVSTAGGAVGPGGAVAGSTFGVPGGSALTQTMAARGRARMARAPSSAGATAGLYAGLMPRSLAPSAPTPGSSSSRRGGRRGFIQSVLRRRR